ncbi:Lrp/AsnC family transcriptional regulator [Hoeflea sp. TYP-13]|uniref:Lrp/AsnC family transcriptional regulator n=1 Tax=Hoeflea sp. TYP-13 TaxID=3230023 RepID=UPI0034C6682B
MHDLDSFDHRLLELLQTDSRQTGKQLSEKVGLSPAACLRRVQRLRQTGIIERDVAVLSPAALAPSVTVIVLLKIARDRPDRADLITKRMLKLRPVKKMYHVTGEADFVLTVVCSSMETYAAFTEAHFYEPYIEGFESIVVLREHTPPVGG